MEFLRELCDAVIEAREGCRRFSYLGDANDVQERRRPDAPLAATPVVQPFACPGCDFVVIVPDEAEGRAVPGRCGQRLASPAGAAGGAVHGQEHHP